MKKFTLIIVSVLLLVSSSLSTFAQQYTKLSDFPENIKSTKPFKRFEWFYQQRAFPNDTIPYIYAFHEYEKAIKRIKSNKNSSKQLVLDWQPLGPAGIEPMASLSHWGITSGRVRAVAVHPNDPMTVYIGAACGGIWKTTDGGDNWLDIGLDLESLSFGAIAIDPNNPEVIYAGSGEVISLVWLGEFAGQGLYKSIDGGNTWLQITNGFGVPTHFSDIEVSPYNSNIIVATIAQGDYHLGSEMPNEGIWKSTDAGITWTKQSNLNDAYDIQFHPTNPDVIYATIGGSTNQSGFYISQDQGETWLQSNNGLQSSNSISRMQFDVSQSNPSIIYAVIYGQTTTQAYKTIDGGANWTQISQGVNLGGLSVVGIWYDQGYYDLCIAVNPYNPDHVLIGNVELHETLNGMDFTPKRPYGSNARGSYVHCDYHKLVFAPSDPDFLYIGCDGGIYQSIVSLDIAYSKNEGLETLQYYRVASHPTDPDILIGGMQDNGIAITYNGGISWSQVLYGDGMECFFDYNDPQKVYASIQLGLLKRSVNGGISFSTIGAVSGVWTTPFFSHTTNPEILYSCNDDIYKKETFTGPFTEITDNLSPYLINTLAQSKTNPMHMILGAPEVYLPEEENINLVMISTDEGYNWTDVSNNIPGDTKWISRVVTHPTQENTMYIVRCGFSEGNKIYKTTDLGATWTNVSGDLPDIPCNDLFIDPDYTNHYYVATDIGVYFSENGGINWEYASNGIPKVPVLDFDYVKIDNTRYLRAATHGRSIYETTNLVIDIMEHEIVSQGSIIAKPNPFTTETTLVYELQESSNVQLSIYNHLGEKLMDLVNEYQVNGEKQFILNGEYLSMGVYICVLKTNKGIQTSKIIKL